MRQVVYIDELLFVNLVMNLTVLWLTSRFTGNRSSLPRTLTAATVGCIYALMIFLPGMSMVGNVFAKFFTAALMVGVAFGYGHWRKFLESFLCLFLISFCVGGLAAGLSNLWGSAVFFPHYNKWLVLAATVLVSLLIGHFGSTLWLKRVEQKPDQISLTVTLWGKKVSLKALVDTGNQLIDPLSQHPVVVVEYEVLRPLLPPEIGDLFGSMRQDHSSLILSLSNSPYATRLRLIPFQSLGKENGLLLGIRPDLIEIHHPTRNQAIKNVVVGISQQRLSPATTYRALLHPQVLAS